MITPELQELVERYLGSHCHCDAVEFKPLVAALRRAIENGERDAAEMLRRIIMPMLDYTSSQSLCRIRARLRSLEVRSLQTTRLAVLGSFTTKQLVPLIDLHLFALGIEAEIYEAEYGVFRQEVLDPGSGIHEFAPNVVFLATSWRDVARRPEFDGDLDALARVVDAELGDWRMLWETLQARLGCQVIQNNFVPPTWRPFGNHEMRHAGSLHRYLVEMNQALVDRAPAFVTVHDVESLAYAWGLRSWDDPRFVHQAKMPCAPEYLVDYAHSVSSLIGALMGSSKKCLVLDLDNTLWGGVVGDEGLGGIRLGQGDPEAESFVAFQQYVKALQTRGVILAVCSKNDEATAREVFEKHPEMVLRPSDISCFVANWDDKATNLRRIAEQLNIGLNSMVFVDDNPAERSLVRRLTPDVAVPELPPDAAEYARVLEDHRYFQVISVGAEDFQRTAYYRGQSQRRASEASVDDIDQFLRSLEMVARVAPIKSTNLERSAQLIQRSNQFNLTTRRHSAAELMALAADPSCITLTVSLADRFGDNGLISVVLARVDVEVLSIDTWLMSCRVLKRGVEQFVLAQVMGIARGRGSRAIRGEYIPTAKNALVREHYSNLGFKPLTADGDGRTLWELALDDGLPPLKHFIKESLNDGYDA